MHRGCRLGAARLGGGALTRLLAGCPDPVGSCGGGDQPSPRRLVSCWLTPAASQIPVESWAPREMSSRAPTWAPEQVRC